MPTTTARRKSDVFADPDDIQQFVNELPDEFLACRGGSHAWDWVTDHIAHANSPTFEQEDQCIHCGTHSVVPLSTSTYVQMGPRKPAYVDGYMAPKGMGRMNSAEGRGIARAEIRSRRKAKAKVRSMAAKKAVATKKAKATAAAKATGKKTTRKRAS